MRGFYRKKFFALVLALIFVLPVLPTISVSGVSPATRQAYQEAQRRAAHARQQVADQQNLLAGTQYEMSQVMAEIAYMDQQIMNVMEALEDIEFALLATEVRIGEASENLETAREERDLQMKVLRERVRVMYEQGSMGLIEVLFQAENVADFFSRWEYIRMVAEFDREMLERLEAAQASYAANYEDLNRSRVLIVDLQQQEELAKIAIEERIDERQQFFYLLHEDAERYAEFLELLEEEARVIDYEFGVIRAEVQRQEAAEAARIRAEQEAARRAAAAARQAEQNARLASLNSFDSFAWPLAVTGTITSEFGNRPDPFTRRTVFHSGVDIAAPGGTRINAAEAGYVRFAGWGAGWGNYIIIDHADGYSTLYAHNSRNRVSTGQRVTRGQHIGDVGTTGRSTGNHLHFEIRRNGQHLNPMSFFR
ncbi:MAG: peptidoglycan DD-metalloendopeptidase family protein [Defluviitaleaceae bacterium]|nr:peptidoglycan DD-metalloendopeptidase family protein [Defluviitaleaceae bacterium]